MALAQLAHLLCADAEEGEHAALRGDEPEVTLRAVLPQLLHHLVAQALDTLAHGGEFRLPAGAQRRLGEYPVHDRRAMIGRHRPDAARDEIGRASCRERGEM